MSTRTLVRNAVGGLVAVTCHVATPWVMAAVPGFLIFCTPLAVIPGTVLGLSVAAAFKEPTLDGAVSLAVFWGMVAIPTSVGVGAIALAPFTYGECEFLLWSLLTSVLWPPLALLTALATHHMITVKP